MAATTNIAIVVSLLNEIGNAKVNSTESEGDIEFANYTNSYFIVDFNSATAADFEN